MRIRLRLQPQTLAFFPTAVGWMQLRRSHLDTVCSTAGEMQLGRSHLDSDTYRAVFRILSHCVEGGRPGRAFPEGGGQGLGTVPDVLARSPNLADAHVGNSPLVEGLGPREVREEVCDDSRNVVSHQERPCRSPVTSDALDDYFVDFSSLMEELGLQEGGGGGGNHEAVSDGLKNKPLSEDAWSLGLSEACPRVDAPEHGGKREGRTVGRTRVDVCLRNESPVGGDLPVELACKDAELLPLPSENPHSVEESCMEAQLRVCDSSRLSTGGSGSGGLGDYQRNIPICTVADDEMEEGEISDEGEVPDIAYGLEFQVVAKEGMQLEDGHLVDDSVEKGNVTHMVGAFIAKGASSGADLIKEQLKSTLHESDQFIDTEELKPQKKSAGKIRKKRGLSNKQPNDDIGLEYQKKTKNGATTKGAISENIVTGHSSLAEVSLKDLAIQNEENPSNMEDVKVQQKRKRAPLTENRKEKKKLAKKRKRAETNRKLGVKRLKLEMMPKPRKVIPCSFYQKGRCQKGESCKFSHDIIPDTKSMPCTFFARGTCLKGDDCPFDHQLSKYPCHSYMSQGRCNRGDSCLFSHMIPIGELSSTKHVSAETDSTTLSGKQGLQKCLKSSNLSSSAVNTSPETTTTGTTFSVPKGSIEQMTLKQPVRMPKGICFLSFGKEPSIGINKQQHALDLKKGGDIQIQEQEEKIILGKLQNSDENLLTSPEKSLSCRTLTSLVNEDKSLSLLQNPPLLVQQNVEIKPCESIHPLRSNTTSSNGSKDFASEESRVADASRILEDFLFSGIA